MKVPQIYCLMNSGKPLTDEVRQVLLINACDMAERGRERQEIRGRRYAGTITSNLESWCYVGMSIVVFEADIVCPDIGHTKVRYGVRTNDLDEGVLSLGKWSTFGEMLEECGIEPPEGGFNPEWN